MKLKVGMYVRWKRFSWNTVYLIGKIVNIDKTWIYLDKTYDNGGFITDSDIQKSSHNIIDLIEEEDLIKYKDDIIYHVGANYSTDNSEKGFRKCIFTFEGERLFLDEMTAEDIKSIVTKEQFESVEYRIGE